MPREPKPYLYRGYYVTDARSIVHHKLCPEQEGMVEAKRQLRAHLHRLDEEQRNRDRLPTPGPGVVPHRVSPDCPAGVKVHEAHDKFLDAKEAKHPEGHAHLTYIHYRDKLLPLYERFGNRTVASLTEEDGQAYKKWLMHEKEWKRGAVTVRGVGPTTVTHFLRAAKTFLNWCAKPARRWIVLNPWADVTYLPERGRERTITEPELGSLLANVTPGNEPGSDEDFKEQLVVLRMTTMRPGELRKLRWDYLQWDLHRAVFPAQVIKTRSRRAVSLLPQVEEVLAKRRQRRQEKGLPVTGYVFPGRNPQTGQRDGTVPQEAGALSQRFRRLVARCVRKGLIVREVAGEKLVPYSTRHTRITELFVEGNLQAVVMSEAGHKVPATTERYKHLADSFVTEQVREKSGSRTLPPQ